MRQPDSPHFHHVHHLLWECYVQLLPLSEDAFADSDLTLPLAGTLDMIGTWPGATVAELSRRTPKTQQAISQLVAKLEQLGYVQRRVGPGRGVGLYLTPAGQVAQADGNRREVLLEQRVRELLGDDTYRQLGAQLEQARGRLRPSSERFDQA
jgi:DNA-binding MarR family transcriptional regulator